MKRGVCVVGSPVLDVIVQSGGALPRSGCTQVVPAVQLAPGGCALNTAVVLARLGVPATMAGLVGTDPEARLLRELLQQERLSLQLLREKTRGRTTVCVAFVQPDGSRGFLLAPGAGEDLTAGDVKGLEGFEALHIGGAAGLTRLDLAALCAEAKQAQVMLTLDVENIPELARSDRLFEALRYVDWFLPSEEELLRFTAAGSVPEALRAVHARGARRVIVKRGSRGALIASEGSVVSIRAFPRRVVDATGAGDCFVAGFLAATLWGVPVPEAVRFACACGGQAVTALGATGAIQSLQSVLPLLGEDLRGEIVKRAQRYAAGGDLSGCMGEQ